ncbi:MAG: hypothetical protein KA715_10115 [Xanthomonadaceae bacterium]|nr:hypothetical protein [Xanthomonadaceae bacterium]
MIHLILVLATSLTSHAQVLIGTEHTGTAEVRIFETTLVIPRNSTRTEKKVAFEDLRESLASLANIRIESRNELVVKENNKKHSEKFVSKIKTITLADVEILPLKETVDGEWVHILIQARVASLPIPKDALSWEIEPNSLFDRIPIQYNQKYLIRFKNELSFMPYQNNIFEAFDVQKKEWNFNIRRIGDQVHDIATFGADRPFLVKMNRAQYSGVSFNYDDGDINFNVLIARPGQKDIKPYGKGEIPTVTEMLEWYSQDEFSSRIEITPAFEIKAKKIGG